MSGRLPGRCVVTGASRGLGASLARELAGRGAQVALIGRSRGDIDAVAAGIGELALPVVADVGAAADVDRAFSTIHASFGGVDSLVTNAAVLGPVSPLWDSDPSAWAHVQQVNVVGAYLCLRAVLRGMVQRGHGLVVGVTSGAVTSPAAWQSAYSTSKAAFEHLHRAAQLEVAGTGVAVCLFDPGGMDTAMMDEVRSADSPSRAVFQRLHDAGGLRSPDRVARVLADLIEAGPAGGERYSVNELDAGWRMSALR